MMKGLVTPFLSIVIVFWFAWSLTIPTGGLDVDRMRCFYFGSNHTITLGKCRPGWKFVYVGRPAYRDKQGQWWFLNNSSACWYRWDKCNPEEID